MSKEVEELKALLAEKEKELEEFKSAPSPKPDGVVYVKPRADGTFDKKYVNENKKDVVKALTAIGWVPEKEAKKAKK